MKRNLLLALSAMIVMATAHAQTLQVNLSWTAPGGATTITVGGTGVETSGPIAAQVYRVPLTAGNSCPAFSTTAYTLVNGSVPETSTSATFSDITVTPGLTYCYAVTDTFAAGGAPSPVSNLFSVLVIISGGSPGQPTGLSGVVVAGV